MHSDSCQGKTHTDAQSSVTQRRLAVRDAVCNCVCVWERKAEGWGESREIHCEQWFCFDFEEAKCYLGFTERPQIRLEVNINMTHSTVLIMHSMVLRTMYNTVQKSFLFLPISALSDGVAKGLKRSDNTFLHL